MNISSYFSSADFDVNLSSIPHILWQYYIEHLWFYEPRSWVARTAAVFRILAIMVATPIALLMMLDIVSYVIARTLGVVEDAKASTSDTTTPHKLEPPAILVESCTPPASDSDPSSISNSSNDLSNTRDRESPTTTEIDSKQTAPEAYFASEEHGLKLSGVGVISPDVSQPPSPTLSRRQLHPDNLSEDVALRRRFGKAIEGIPE